MVHQLMIWAQFFMSIESRLPLYIQLSELLIREISAGRLLDGEKLPPERDMAKQHNTTVRTLRKALDELTTKGLLERRQGSGNYICANANAESVYSFFRIELIGGGGLPKAIVISADTLPKPDDLPKFGTSDFAHRIRRLRFLNGIPSVLEEIWLDGAYTNDISADDLSDSLYLYYKNDLKLWITRAEDEVSLNLVPDWSHQDFGIPAGQISGFVERMSWSQDNQIAEYSRNWFDHTKARYGARIK